MTSQPLRAAIFMPRANTFYLSLLFGLKRGFERHNVEVFASTSMYDEPCLLEFCNQFKPDLIFEMNRSRSQLPNLPRHIKHAAWIVDTLGHTVDYYHGSDMTYFFGGNWKRAFTADGGLVDWLPPGACEISYDFQPQQPVSDFSFVGHIPKPWTEEELSREICNYQNQTLKFGQLHDELLDYWKAISFENFENITYLTSAYELVEQRYGQKIDIEDQRLRYDLGCRMVRLRNRHQLMSLVLQSSDSMRIYGSENWTDWPQYRPHYHHFVDHSRELKQIYQSTKLNLHEGVGPHFRVFDAMSAGGLMFAKRTPDDSAEGGILEIFEPFVHYVPFSEEDFAELADKYLSDDAARQKIVANAADNVRAHHTWTHRAEKIIQDYYRVV
ncbi:MAG: glycosyltransferase family 1 protein [Methylobacter sp.]|nr:MAG: glycosyltransferase family 1 protein [Methylobacter sp.]